MTLKDILTAAELHLYKRHIEDGMSLEDLSAELETPESMLQDYWNEIEDKLRKTFAKHRKAETKHGRIGYL